MNNSYDINVTKKAQMRLCDKTVSAELTNDYTLPDYQPEIRRVLRVSASALPTSKYVNGSRCELAGTVDYKLLYAASDGRLYTVPLASEYSVSLPIELPDNIDTSEGVTILCDAYVEGASARVSAPRRLSVKSRVCVRARAYGNAELSEETQGECDENSVERLMGSTRSEFICAGVGESREITAELDTVSESTRIIDALAEAYITDSRVSDSYVDCKGEVRLALIMCDDDGDGDIKTVVKKLPFEDSVELEASAGECDSVAKGYVSDLKVSVEDGRILCVMTLFVTATAHAESKISYTKDLYSTEKKSECAHSTVNLPTPVCCVSANFSQNEKIELPERDSADGTEAVCAFCDCIADSLTFDKGRYALTGISKYNVITKKDGEYASFEREIPFRYEFSAEGPCQSYYALVSPMSCEARIDGNVMSVSSELSVTAELSGECGISYVSCARYLDAAPSHSTDMIICYPDAEDTLWSVSKRYSCPLLSLDGISDAEEKLDGIGHIVVNF